VIVSLNAAIKPEAANKVISERTGDENGSKPYKDTASFITTLLKESAIPADDPANKPNRKTPQTDFRKAMEKIKLTVKSEFFEMTANAQIGDSQLTMMSLLHRNDTTNGTSINTLRRGLGEY